MKPIARSLPVLAAVLLVSLAPPTLPADEDPETPEWARSLKLVSFGGPPRANVEILLNGEFVGEIKESIPTSTEVADLIRPGVNEVRFRLTRPEVPREHGNLLEISVSPVVHLTTHQHKVEKHLAGIQIPGDFLPETSCEETRQFWAGPFDSKTSKPLKESYWLFVSGPPVGHCVRVVLNGVPVADLSAGNRLIEVTPFLRKGKNTVVFEGRPTCLVPESGQTGPLTFEIAPARQEVEVVRMTESPIAVFEIDNRRRLEPFSKSQTFRAW